MKLNQLLSGNGLRERFKKTYEEAKAEKICLPEELVDFMSRASSLNENERMILNRLIIEFTYRAKCPKRESLKNCATAVSHDGSVVVGWKMHEVWIRHHVLDKYSPTDIPGAFVWDAAHGMRSLKSVLTDDYKLDVDLSQMRNATGISADGKTIVGEDLCEDMFINGAWIALLDKPLP